MSAIIPRFYVYNKADQSYWEVANPTDPSEIENTIRTSRTMQAALRAVGWISAIVFGGLWLGIPDPSSRQGAGFKAAGMIFSGVVATMVCFTKLFFEAHGEFDAAKIMTRHVKQNAWKGFDRAKNLVPGVRLITVDIQESPLKEVRVDETEWVRV